MSGRLGGGSRKVDKLVTGNLVINTHNSMSEALDCTIKGQTDYTLKSPKRRIAVEILRECLTGNSKLAVLIERADALIDAAILQDPRLNRKHAWVRLEEGIDACPALVSSGEPASCLDRRKLKLADQASAEPVRIVISTDSTDDASEEHVVAFIAITKLAQQFRPLEIWWQGAWLTPGRTSGQVLLAPLVQGDMDFARVQFFLSNPFRDSMSYRCMWYHAVTKHSSPGNRVCYEYGGERGERSYLPDTFEFISEKGIRSDDWWIAATAAEWAGLEPLWREEVSPYSAQQEWRPERKPAADVPITDEDRARWRKQDEEAEKQRLAEAKKRMTSIA